MQQKLTDTCGISKIYFGMPWGNPESNWQSIHFYLTYSGGCLAHGNVSPGEKPHTV